MCEPGREIANTSMGQSTKGNFIDAAGGPFYCNIASGDKKPYRLTKEEHERLNGVQEPEGLISSLNGE
jgi:hypothetical protein